MKQYIKFDEAKNLILRYVKPLGTEYISTRECLFRVVAEDIIAKYDVPNYNNSAMDGFAIKSQETINATKERPVVLKIVDVLPAGKRKKIALKENICLKVMTGSLIPDEFDAVIEKELVEETSGYIKIFNKVEKYRNIRFRAEDIKKGDKLLPKGIFVSPVYHGIIISCGYETLKVYKLPKVGIIATGDELVDIEQQPKEGQVKNVNTYTLTGLVKKLFLPTVCFGIVKDNFNELKKVIRRIIFKENVDVLLISGGVSKGEYDLVKPVLGELGVIPVFWEVRQRPGKPLYFGVLKDKNMKYIFGIPGNVASNIIVFEMLIKPALIKLTGRNDFDKEEYFEAVLEEDIKKKIGVKTFLRGSCIYKDGKIFVKTTGLQGSGILKSMIGCNCIIILDENISFLQKGAIIKIKKVDW